MLLRRTGGQNPDDRHPTLLRPCRERPRCRAAHNCRRHRFRSSSALRQRRIHDWHKPPESGRAPSTWQIVRGGSDARIRDHRTHELADRIAINEDKEYTREFPAKLPCRIEIRTNVSTSMPALRIPRSPAVWKSPFLTAPAFPITTITTLLRRLVFVTLSNAFLRKVVRAAQA